MAGGYGQRLRLRLFLEGVEVPVIGAQVQVAPNSPAVCSIQIPPLPEGTRFLPRTLVHLFFLDFYTAQSPFPVSPQGATNTNTNQSPDSYEFGLNNTPAAGGTPTSSAVGDSPDLQNANYKLLFGGEVAGFQWSKNQAQRSLILQCQDWSNYWDYAQQWNNTDLFGPGIKALFSGGSTNLFTDFLEDEGSAIIRIIQTPSISYPNLKGLLGGIVHLLEAIGGSYNYGKNIAGTNIFYSLAELRLHITQMITAYEQDPTASRLLSAGYDSLLGRTLGNLGQQVSIRQAINALMSAIFHETYAQCCPGYVPATAGSASTLKSTTASTGVSSITAFDAQGYAGDIRQVQSSLAALTDGDTGTFTNYDTADEQASLTQLQQGLNETAMELSGKTGADYAARVYFVTAAGAVGQALAALKSNAPANATAPLNNALSQLTQVQPSVTTTTGKPGTAGTPARLNQQIFRPDVWFTAPPRCNVIFPENYHTLAYSRSFLQEPTRLLLKTNNEFYGEDELFDEFYYAPKGFTVQTGGRELQDVLANGILDHELFTGILPIFEKMGELNIFGARSGTVKGKVPKIGLAQRSTNFLYFKYRFAARQLQVSGKFNPYLACGFPALVVDKYVDAQTLQLRQQLIQQNGGVVTNDMNRLLGTHFLCNLTEVEHSVDQKSGATNLNCSYARQPDEGSEFLGVVRPGQMVQKRSDTDASRTSVVAAITAPQINSLGPNQGAITAVQDVTQANSRQTLPLYQGPAIAGSNTPSVTVKIGVSQAASAYSSGVTSIVGNPSQNVLFHAYRVTESVPRYSRQTVDLPMEEYIRPGWYGDCWHPSIVGQVYQEFFGTGAITDQQQVDGANGGSIGVPSAQAQQALAQAQKALDADDPNAWAAGLLALDQNASIADAVAFIVSTYSYVKQNKLDTDDYIRNYTWRPVATMVDMFGTSNLMLDQQGSNVVQGIEGFHSRAFGPYNNLFGLTTPDIENIVGITRGSTAAQRADTRARKQQAVQEYVSQLQYARAILG